jgi:hypothetical protein
MAVPHPIAINYRELYSDPTNNPFGTCESEKETFYEALYEAWRATSRALNIDVLLQNILSDPIRPIEGIRVFVPYGTSIIVVLEIMHAVDNHPGISGQAHAIMKPFALLGNIIEVEITTVAFNQHQLAVPADTPLSAISKGCCNCFLMSRSNTCWTVLRPHMLIIEQPMPDR